VTLSDAYSLFPLRARAHRAIGNNASHASHASLMRHWPSVERLATLWDNGTPVPSCWASAPLGEALGEDGNAAREVVT
jgi:hypothetical protein